MTALITICARAGSKGLADKNIRPLNGIPLLEHSIRHAKAWNPEAQIVLSTDSERYAELGRSLGIAAPFMRPADLANDSAGKIPVLVHALNESERAFGKKFEYVLDLDVSAPLRTLADIQRGYQAFKDSGADVCFSVTEARRSPYFNMVERDASGKVSLCKKPDAHLLSRQSSPKVWDLNASIYFYRREYLMTNPTNLWGGKVEIFEMPEETAFDINTELEFRIVELIQAR